MPGRLALTKLCSTLLALGAILLCGGAHVFYSDVPAAPADAPVEYGRLRDGVYCAHREGEPARIRDAHCARFRIEEGRLLRTSLSSDEVYVAELATLTRGATLAQTKPGADLEPNAPFYLTIAIIRDNSFAILPLARLTARDLAEAQALGVELDQTQRSPAVLITGGAPEAVRAWITGRIDAQFDRALREPKLFERMMTTSLMYVRVAEPGQTRVSVSEADIAEAVVRVKTGLRFAITLE